MSLHQLEIVKIHCGYMKNSIEGGDTWHRVERSSGKFMRFRLPENAKLDQVKAAMEKGVLTVTVPKEVKRPDVKAIEISG